MNHRANSNTNYDEVRECARSSYLDLFLPIVLLTSFQKAAEQRIEEERKEYIENRRKLLDAGLRTGSTLRLIVHKVSYIIIS